MENLTQRDFRALQDFLRETYKARDFDCFVAHLVSQIPKLVPTDLVGYAEMDLWSNTSRNCFYPDGVAGSATDRAWKAHMHEHPVLTYSHRSGDGRARKISDFLAEQAFRRSGLYNEVYRRMDTEDVLCFALPLNQPKVVGVALHRGRRNFTEPERQRLNLIRPHLAQAWRNAKAFTEIQKRLTSAQRALDHVDQGVVVLDEMGRTRFMTSRARQSIHEYFGNTAHLESHLPEELERWIKHHESCDAEREIEESKIPFVRERGDGRLVIRLLTDAGQSLLLLREHKVGIDPACIAPLGITPREAEVLAWVARGKTNLEIASIVGSSSRTVQKHLEHVFQKIGVETRTAAAVRFLEVTGKAKPIRPSHRLWSNSTVVDL